MEVSSQQAPFNRTTPSHQNNSTTTTTNTVPMRKHHKGRGPRSTANNNAAPQRATSPTSGTTTMVTPNNSNSNSSGPERPITTGGGMMQPLPPPQPKPRGRAASKMSHSRSYPRGVGLDFRKLTGLTLMSYIDHHGVKVRNEAPPSELAVAVARHFESMEVDEEQVIGGFLSRLSSDGADYARNTAYFDGTASSSPVRKRRRSKNAARPSEQVAAKVTRTDENGSWILASVQRFYPDTETYDVQDEDDTSKLIRLPWNHVMRLSTGETSFNKGAHVMAIFPETTSFYRAVVSKQPVWKLQPGSTTPIVKELILKFEDDEDENGRTPHRRVPSRYVIPVPSKYFHEDDDDVDLTHPSASSGA